MHRVRLLEVRPKIRSLGLYLREPFCALRKTLHNRHNPRFTLTLQHLDKEAFGFVRDRTIYRVFECLNKGRDVRFIEVERDDAVDEW